jgi:hypothetical protein
MSGYQPTTRTNTLHVKLGYVGTVNPTSIGSAAIVAGFPTTAWDPSPGFRAGDVGAPITLIGAGATAPVTPVFGPIGKMLVTTLASFSSAADGVMNNPALNITESGASNLTIYRDVKCLEGSISVNWAISSIAAPTAQFTVASENGSVVCAVGMPVLIADDAAVTFANPYGAVWGGSLDQIVAVNEPGSSLVYYQCSCVSWAYLLIKRIVSMYILTGGVYPAQAVDVTFTDLIYNYCNSDGLSVHSVVSPPTLPAMTETGKTLSDALTDLATAASTAADATWLWWIDPWRVVHLEAVTTLPAPWGIDEITGTDGNVLAQISITTTREKLANRCYLESDLTLMPATSASYRGDGTTRDFSVQCPIGAVPTIDVNGSAKTVATKPTDPTSHTAQWYWESNSNVLTQDTTETVLGKNDALNVTYQPLETQHFLGDVTASFDARSAVEGGTGYWETSVTVSDAVIPYADGNAKALAKAEVFSDVPEALDIQTYRPGLAICQILSVKLPSLGISSTTSFLIDQVDLITAGNYQMWKVHAVNGALIGDWRTAFAQLAGGPGSPGGGITAATPAVSAAAPNITSATVVVSTEASATAGRNVTISGIITLPTTDPNYDLLAAIRVYAIGPAPQVNHYLLTTLRSSGGDPTVAYKGTLEPQPSSDETWSIEFDCYDAADTPTANPVSYSATVLSARIGTVVGFEHTTPTTGRYIDAGGGYHTQIDITVTLNYGQVPQTVTFWLSFDNGATWQWQGWTEATTSPFTASFDAWLPNLKDGAATWKAAAKAGPALASNPTLASGALVSSGFTITPVSLGSVTAADIPTARWKGTDTTLHTVIGFDPAQLGVFMPVILTAWLDYGDGVKHWQGWIPMTVAGQTLYIGSASTALNGAPMGTDDVTHVPTIGSVYAPLTVALGTNWNVTIAVGEYDSWEDPPAVPLSRTSANFNVDPPSLYVGTEATGASIGTLTYQSMGGDVYNFGWQHMYVTLPLTDPNFFFARFTVQTGSGTGGSFVAGGAHPAEEPVADWATDDNHSDFMSRVTGTNQIDWAYPNRWGVPTDSNGTFRFRIYVASRRDDGTGGTKVLQSCWAGGASYLDAVPVVDLYRTVTTSGNMVAADSTVHFDTSGISHLTSTALNGAIADTFTQDIVVDSYADIVVGTYIQIGTEKMYVTAKSTTAGHLSVTRGAYGTTAATHLDDAEVVIPGCLAFTLLTIAAVPNHRIALSKVSNDINYVKILPGGSNTLPGQVSYILLSDDGSQASNVVYGTNNAAVVLMSPGIAGTQWSIVSGAGIPGGPGPAGPEGGTGPPACNVTATLTGGAPTYTDWNAQQWFGFAGTISIDTGDSNYANLKRLEVWAYSPAGVGHWVCAFTTFSASFAYSGVVALRPASAQTWSLKFLCFNQGGDLADSGNPSIPPGRPYAITGITVAAADVLGNVTPGTPSYEDLGNGSYQVHQPYTAPSPLGLFDGVLVEVEEPDQSAAAPLKADGTMAWGGNPATGEIKPFVFGPFDYVAADPQASFVIPAPAVAENIRIRLRSVSVAGNITNSSSGAPSTTLAVAAYSPSNPDAATAYCQMATWGVTPITANTPYSISGKYEQDLTVAGVVEPGDPRFCGWEIYSEYPGDANHYWEVGPVRGAGVTFTLAAPATRISVKFWLRAVSKDPVTGAVLRNPIVPGITPSFALTLGVTDGVTVPGSAVKLADPLTAVGDAITVANAKITHDHLAAGAVTAANAALAANAVIDSNVVSVGINKVTYGTTIFAGDVVLSRGISLPVIVLQNSGAYFFGQADASTGATGLTSKPYVAVQSTGIGIYSGTTTSVIINSSSITLYSVSGDTGHPFVTLSGSSIVLQNGNFTTTVSASEITLANASGVQIRINSSGITLAAGASITSPAISGGTISGTTLSLNANGVTTTVSNIYTAWGYAGVKVLLNADNTYSIVTPNHVGLFDSLDRIYAWMTVNTDSPARGAITAQAPSTGDFVTIEPEHPVSCTYSSWDHFPLHLGYYTFWVDFAGRLRMKLGFPTGDTDGQVVGAQS